MGDVDRAATGDEIEKMRGLVRQGMDDGAFGLSSGLFYVPGTFTPTAEVVELARVAGGHGRHLHLAHARRSRGRRRQRERDDRHRRDGRPADAGDAPQGRRQEELGTLGRDAAADRRSARPRRRRDDRPVPLHGVGTSIGSALLPAWAHEGGGGETLEAAQRPGGARQDSRPPAPPSSATSAAAAIRRTSSSRAATGTRRWPARISAQITQSRGLPVTLENAAETAMWIVEQGGAQGIFHAINEDDLERILVHPATMIGSDGEVPIFGKTHPHPRSYGTFVRVLGVYVRERSCCRSRPPCRRCRRSPPSGSASPIAACCVKDSRPTSPSSIRRRFATPRPSRSRTATPKA